MFLGSTAQRRPNRPPLTKAVVIVRGENPQAEPGGKPSMGKKLRAEPRGKPMLGEKPASQGNPVTHLRAPASTLRASPPLPTWPSPHGGKGIGGLRDLRVIWPRASYRGRGRWAMQSAGKSYGSDSASGESQSADAPSPSPFFVVPRRCDYYSFVTIIPA